MRARRAGAGGFTLLEILAAFMVLTLGVGSVLAVLSGTVARERGAVMRNRILDVLPYIEEIVRERVSRPGELAPMPREPVSFMPALSWSAGFQELADWPGEILARIGVTWQEGGEAREEVFLLLLSRSEPFGTRLERVLAGGRERTGETGVRR